MNVMDLLSPSVTSTVRLLLFAYIHIVDSSVKILGLREVEGFTFHMRKEELFRIDEREILFEKRKRKRIWICVYAFITMNDYCSNFRVSFASSTYVGVFRGFAGRIKGGNWTLIPYELQSIYIAKITCVFCCVSVVDSQWLWFRFSEN